MRQSGEAVRPFSYAARFLIRGTSPGAPNWHQPTQSSPSYTRAACARPSRTRRSLADRLCSGSVRESSSWKPMHQQPPKMPLLRSNSAANAAHVASSRARTVYAGSAIRFASAECAERRADLFGEELRLFPGGEVAAPVDLVVVDEVGVGPLGPAARRLILLAGEDARGHRDGHALGVEEAELVFPVQTRRRDPGVRHPVERDVVEDLLTRQLAGGARGPVQRRGDRRGRLAAGIVVVQQPGGQADG